MRKIYMNTYSNIVRFIVKEGKEENFLEVFNTFVMQEGENYSILVHTGDREYVAVGAWESEDAMVNARPAMIGNLDQMRDLLEEISPELGVTDPRSGKILIEWN